MNKRVIKITTGLLFILIFGIFAINTYAYSTKLTDTEYVSTMNTYLGEMKINTEHKGGNMWKALLYGLDDSYLKPEIDKLTILKSGVVGLKDNVTTFKLRNKLTQERHQEIISKLDNIISLLDKDINDKETILNHPGDDTAKYEMIKKLDLDIDKNIKNEFYNINTILQKINVENY